jgi:hypothetical protein
MRLQLEMTFEFSIAAVFPFSTSDLAQTVHV